MMTASDHVRPLLGPVILPSAVMAFIMGMAQPVLPLYLQSNGASFAMTGLVLSARTLGALLITLPGGVLFSSMSLRTLMAAGFGGASLALLGIYLFDNNWMILAGWLLAGMSFALYEMARYQFIALFVARRVRGRAIVLLGGTFRMGGVLGPIFGGWLAHTYSFQVPFLWMVALALPTAALLMFSHGHTRDVVVPRSQAPARAYWTDLRQTLAAERRIFLTAGSGLVLMQMLRQARPVLIPLFGSNVIGLDVAEIGFVLTLGSMVDVAMFVPAGLVMDKIGRKMAIVPSLVGQALGLLLLPWTGGLWSLAAVTALVGFSNGLSSGTMLTLGADLAPEGHSVPFLALWRTTSSLGFTIGAGILGLIAELFSLLTSSLLLSIVGFTAAWLFGRHVPETIDAESRPARR